MTYLVPNIGISVSSKNFAIRQIGRCSFQVSQWFFKILAQKYRGKIFFGQKYPKMAFLVVNFGIFAFLQNLAITQIRGSGFQI